ncbi:lytic transglycosylase domain-containing protein [Palleronia caenipelagi]|uniref:Lytic transglycosylase domain-containing protein n=1 Tax=Palleronia caenipelagi TaxID=2489174 RepID=A0A547Q895_9RHOB|nr:lytic transglycosylase domain-containing protein [Palleronia caenipelagi]TRD22607.1 lytic transglycosylase domain-containing protein [Palleronia caenipelagi]
MTKMLALLISLMVPHTAPAATLSQTGGGPFSMAEVMEAGRAGTWFSRDEIALRTGPLAADIVSWMRLREGQGTFAEALGFLERHPDWPGLARLRREMEEALPTEITDETTARRVLAFFGEADPATGQGVIAKTAAYLALDRRGEAEAGAALAWAGLSMTPTAENYLINTLPDIVLPLETIRANAMFWRGARQALARAEDRAEARGDLEATALIRARLAALTGSDALSVTEDLPETLRDDPGLAYRRFALDYGARRYAEARDIALTQSTSADTLGDPEAWARARRDLVRRELRSGTAENAYALAAAHWLTEGADFADLEWLAGYIALRYLSAPEDALRHFLRMRGAVASPISVSRGEYWIGRTHEVLDQAPEAAAAYRAGANWQSAFYGLLSAERIGLNLDAKLMNPPDYPPLAETDLAGSSVLQAALLLQAAGERSLAEQFLTHLAEGVGEAEAGALADTMLALGEPHLALRIAKAVALRGIVLPRAYFPLVDLGQDSLPVPEELALAIARRESEFDPIVSSGVGAGGLMQLMPGTARDVSRDLGITYNRERLFSDPSYNARLGTAYLQQLQKRFGSNPVLVSAGYNAGPGRPARWMSQNGDPRDPLVDVVDWIEAIPFDETRNYVMRVAESLPIYRARLSGETSPVMLTKELKDR